MGILAGFIGGAARATGQIADQRIARYTAEEIQRQRDLMDQERERRIEEAQIAREGRAVAQREKDRTDMTSRVDKEAGLIADAAISAKRGLIDQGIVDRNSWTPEQQKVVDDALAAERQSIASDIDTKYKASVNTGDTSLQNAALMDKQEKRLDMQAKKDDEQTKFNNRRLDMQDEWQKKQDNIRNKMLQLQEERAKRSEDKFDDQQSKAELNSTRLSLQSVLKDIATQEDKLQLQISSATDPEQQKIMIRKMEELDALRVESRNYLLDLAGVKKDKSAPKVDPFDLKVQAKVEAVRKGNNPPPPTSAAPTVPQAAPAPKETKPTAAAPQQSSRAYDGGLNLRPLIESISSRVSSNNSARDVANMTRLIQAKNRARIELTPEEQAFAKENKIY